MTSDAKSEEEPNANANANANSNSDALAQSEKKNVTENAPAFLFAAPSTAAELGAALTNALLLELSTLPLYINAWLSIPATPSPAASDIIKGVLMQEMVHMSIVTNLMNSVFLPAAEEEKDAAEHGAQLALPDCNYLLSYGADQRLPGGVLPNLAVPLAPMTDAQLQNVLIPLEMPPDNITNPSTANPYQPASGEDSVQLTYASNPGADNIGQFYEALMAGLDALATRGAVVIVPFDNQITQVHNETVPQLSGDTVAQRIASCDAALQRIIVEGEGSTLPDGDLSATDGQHFNQLSHYFRLIEILVKRKVESFTETPNGSSVYTLTFGAAITRGEAYPLQVADNAEFTTAWIDLLLALTASLPSGQFGPTVVKMYALSTAFLAAVKPQDGSAAAYPSWALDPSDPRLADFKQVPT